MKIHFTNLYGHAHTSVALMAQNTCMEIARSMGVNELAIFSYDSSHEPWPEKSARFDGIIAGISYGDTVFYQSPTWNSPEWDTALIDRMKLYGVRLVIFIHDDIPLMFASNYYLMSVHIEMYNKADAIIVPSEIMRDRLIEEGLTVKNILIQKMWDYTHTMSLSKPSFCKRLYFAGQPSRFPYIENWSFPTPLHVFSSQNINETSTLKNEGWKNKDELLLSLSKGGFGLVWGNHENPEEEEEYYKMNISYKLSTYLAAGIPVIVPYYLSNIEYIKDRELGYVVSSLEEASSIVQNCTEEDYSRLVENVKSVSSLISGGYFTKKLIIDSVMTIK